jgi:Fe2+ transport system protein FeoA
MIEQSVTQLKKGEKARVIAIHGPNPSSIRKLIVFGLLPGREIEVVQTVPVYVLKIDNTLLALDYEAAYGITVLSK